MKVYLVQQQTYDQGDYVWVFSTREKAEAYAEKLRKRHKGSWGLYYTVEECEVDSEESI